MLADIADQVLASDAIHLAVAIPCLDGDANLVHLGRSPLAAERGFDEGDHRVGVIEWLPGCRELLSTPELNLDHCLGPLVELLHAHRARYDD